MDTSVIETEFLVLLESSDLLSEKDLRAVQREFNKERGYSAKTIAENLVLRNLLTPFQAERILAGRARGFFYGRYKLLDILGFGGTSRVYLAEDTKTRRRIALKVLSENYEHDVGMITRLKLEGHVGRMLQHPHVLHTERVGNAAGSQFLVMEHIEGVELQELIDNRGPVPVGQACDIICQAARGLYAAHQAGIVHRDVKPANLLIDLSGHVKVADFGLALLGKAAADEEFSLAMIFGHNCLGTAYYVAPEQTLDSHAVDARADIYALGCTLYHTLAGKLPFPAADNTSQAVRDVVRAQRTEQAPPITNYVNLPQEVVEIVERMMAKRPKHRFQSAEEVVDALTPFAHRARIELDLKQILSDRVTRARRRAAASQSGRRSSVGSMRGMSSIAGSQARRSHARIETAVNHDTLPQMISAGSSIPDHSPPEQAPSPPTTDSQAAARTRNGAASSPPATLIPRGSESPIPLVRDRVVIGRDPECDVVLSGNRVSSRHCELWFADGMWHVRDLNSKNGIRVNGKTVHESALSAGDRLTIAEYFRYAISYQQDRSISFLALLLAGLAATAAVTALVWSLLS